MVGPSAPQSEELQLRSLPWDRPPKPFPEIAAALRDSTERIVEYWRERTMLVRPQLRRLTAEEFEDAIREILTSMADAIERNSEDDWRLLGETAPTHGFHRFQQDFTLTDLLNEYRILRKAALMHVEEQLQRRSTREEAEAIHAAIDFMIRQGTLALVKQQKELLLQTSQTKLKYLSFFSHDLANHLLIVSASMESIKHELARHAELLPAAQMLQRGLGAIQQIKQGVQRMVEHERLSRDEAAGTEAHVEAINLRQMVLDIKGLIETQAQQKNLDIEIDIPLDASALTDPNLLVLVLRNLIGNAIKHAAPPPEQKPPLEQEQRPDFSGGRVRIAARRIICHDHGGPGNSCWEISVSDNGPGIPNHMQEAIRELLNRGGLGSLGAGVGLALVAQACRILQSDIELQSTPEIEQGTTFRFTIPAAPHSAQTAGR